MENLELTTYKNKKVLITGHTGFKGAWLTLLLHKLGATVYGLSLAAKKDSLYTQIEGDKLCTSFNCDIRNQAETAKLIQKIQADFIFHLAAQSLVIDGYKDPISTYQTNVMGTLNILEAARNLDRCNIIIVTTDKVYENPETGAKFKEDDPLGGYDPYSSSKACTEILTASMRRSYFNKKNIKIVTARAGNVIGGGDYSANRIIPDIVNALKNNEPIVLRSPNSTRPWQHVLDVLNGYLLLGKHLDLNQNIKYNQWNFGPSNEDTLSVLELANTAIDYWGSGKIEINNSDQVHEATFLGLESKRANTVLKWNPKFDSKEAISKTIDWYKKFYKNTTPEKKYGNF